MTQPQPNQQADNNHEAEVYFLATVMTLSDRIGELAERIQPDDFFFLKHGWIWEAMIKVAAGGGEVVPLAVADALRQAKRLDEIGGQAYLTQILVEGALPPEMDYDAVIDASARIIEREAYRRRLMAALGKIAEFAQANTDAEAVQEFALESLERAGANITREMAQQAVSGPDMIDQFAEILLKRSTGEIPRGFAFEWPEMRAFVPRVPLGKIVLISAFTGIGKSLFAEAMAELAAMMGLPVFFLSAEMTLADFMDRSAARNTSVPLYVWQGRDEEQHAAGLKAYIQKASPWLERFTFWPGGENLSAALAYRQIERAIDSGAKFVVVDYLTALQYDVMEGGRVVRTRQQAISNFVDKLHALAATRDVIIVIVSQLSQDARGDAHTRGSKTPEFRAALHIHITTQEMKESRLFTFGERTIAVSDGERSPMRKIEIRKNRFGRTGKTELFLDGECARFISPSVVYSDYVSPERAERLKRATAQAIAAANKQQEFTQD